MHLNQVKIGNDKIMGFSRKRIDAYQSCHTVSKKLIIRNFEFPKPVDQHECWPKLERAVLSIFNPLKPANSESIIPSLEELYTAVQNLCSRNKSYGEETYQKLKDLVNVYVRETMLLAILEDNDQPLLTILEQGWDSYCVKMRMIRNIFLCLDRIYVLSTPRLVSIWDMSLEMFRKEIIFHENVLQRLLQSLLEVIASERGDPSTQQLPRIQMRNIMRMMIDLDMYESFFEPKFLQESRGYYNAEAASKLRFVGNITDDNIISYLDFVADKLKDEELRVIAYGLDLTSTLKRIEKIIEKELLESHLDLLITNCIDLLFLDKKNLRHIKLAYQLFSRVPDALKRLCSCFNAFVKNRGKTLLNLASSDPEKDKTLIKDLLDFKDLMDVIVRECLNSNERFANTLKDAFETFVNIRTNKVAELIAKHVDGMLRDSNSDTMEVSFDQQVDKVLVLFRFIHGKDIFEAFYQRSLSKRLLGGKSASVDAEKLVLLKLKQECGGAFTSKLEAMFKDMESSKELTAAFKMYLGKQENASKRQIDLSVSVLTTGIWPTYQPIELLLSEDLRQYEDVFRDFYLAKHTGRKLTWQHCFGHCLLKAQFGPDDKKRDKELQVSFLQALVLMQFNQKNDFSYQEIRAAILPTKLEGTEENDLRRTLQSLACGKIRVLTKNPKSRDVLDTDSFSMNDNFEHKLFRLKINQVQWKETFEESVNTQEKVNQDRQYQLDAAAVRIMKARKTMLHNALVNEIYEKVNFPASSAETKKRIESLIERDYLRRDKENSLLYHYVA